MCRADHGDSWTVGMTSREVEQLDLFYHQLQAFNSCCWLNVFDASVEGSGDLVPKATDTPVAGVSCDMVKSLGRKAWRGRGGMPTTLDVNLRVRQPLAFRGSY